ncbi:MAG: SurA N-terminal domain-containing protein [Bacteroidetes bacterium]|nr:SurA N-terminal domain-containing protein [Bacteroidota bacterium]
MAMITRIRKHSGLIVFFIGVAMVLFVVTDALNSRIDVLSGQKSNKIGKVNGVTITYDEFNARYQYEIEIIRLQNSLQGLESVFDDTRYAQINDFAWNGMLEEKILDFEFRELGLVLTDDELYDLIQGPNPHPVIRQFPYFINPNTNTFDPAAVSQFLQSLENPELEEQIRDPRRLYEHYKQFIYHDQIKRKYVNTILKGVHVSTWQAKEDYIEKNKRANIDYIFVNYNTIADSSISVTDKELQSYLNKNKKKYQQQEEIRQIDYVTFSLVPSAEDTLVAKSHIEEATEKYITQSDDSLFLLRHSQTDYDPDYYPRDEVNVALADSLFKVDSGTVLGPFFEEGSFISVKLINRKLIADSIHARHILIGIRSEQEFINAVSLLDSVQSDIEGGASFEELATLHSQHRITKEKGGDMGWIQRGVEDFLLNTALFFTHDQGDIFKIYVPSQGLHLIEILEATPTIEAVKLGFLTQPVEASTKTTRGIYSMAGKFAAENQKPEDFIKAFENLEETVVIKKNISEPFKVSEYLVSPLGSARPVVYWSYNVKEKSVSSVLELSDKYVVAYLSDVRKKGTKPLEDIKLEIEAEVRKEKKAKKIIDNIEAKSGGSTPTTLDQYAQIMEQDIRSAEGITFNTPFIAGIGRELTVTGMLFGMQSGTISDLIKGENGIVVLTVKEFLDPPETLDYSPYRNQMESTLVSRTEAQVMEDLRKNSKIIDSRHKFYNQ